jgi:hypothetical protein
MFQLWHIVFIVFIEGKKVEAPIYDWRSLYEGIVIHNFSSGRAVHRISRMNSMAKNGRPVMMGEQQPFKLHFLRPSSKHSGPIQIAERSV